MTAEPTKIDPDWAWSPFVPDEKRPWNRRLAAHLYRRAGFGASRAQLDEAVHQKPAEVVESLLASTSQTVEFERQSDELAGTLLALKNPRSLSAWWLHRMLQTPRQLVEKTTLFWHGHFATGADKVTDAALMLRQNTLLRQHALSKFGPLVQAISRDPAMLLYLDSATNRKRHPNENYARELMELFCLGLGKYTEKDIQELARCFTGWEVRDGEFRFNQREHDAGAKTVLGQSGEFSGEQAADVVLAQPAAARFIARKIVRFFLFDEPEPPDALIAPLADDFRRHDLDAGSLVRRVLASNLFYSEHSVGRKVRSPVELSVGLLRSLEGTTNVSRLADDLDQLGQAVFFPPNVKGWDGGRSWLNSSTLLGRANLVGRLVLGGESRFAEDSLDSLAERRRLDTPEQSLDWICEQLVAVELPEAVRRQLLDRAASAGTGAGRRLGEMINSVGMLPEFQLC